MTCDLTGRSGDGRGAGEPIASGICHCRTCRKAASAPTLPFSTFPADHFTFTRGDPVEFRSSLRVTRGFCGRCGSPLTHRNHDELDVLDTMTCSLDHPDIFPPTSHSWISHRPAWDHIADGLPAYRITRAARQPAKGIRAMSSGQRPGP